VQGKKKKISIQEINPDFQKDFLEVWKKIKKSIRIYEQELNNRKFKNSDNNNTFTNLNLEL
jgi:ketopantoate hydroxymethyltransferase